MLIGLREVTPGDLEQLVTLFKETVHTVNAKDYTPEQLEAWAPSHAHHSHERWQSMLKNKALVAEVAGFIVGFADITPTGYLDRLFVHKDYQRMGVAKCLVESIETYAHTAGIKKITTEASITAKPFFEKMGYQVIEQQQKKHAGVVFTNYVMEKRLDK